MLRSLLLTRSCLRTSMCTFRSSQKLTVRVISSRHHVLNKFLISPARINVQTVRYASSNSNDNKGGNNGKNKKEVSHEELVALIESGDIQLIDVREAKELQEYGYISPAVNIPLRHIAEALRMSPEKFKVIFGADKPDEEDDNIVFHCLAGVRSGAALDIAHELGYKKAKHYPGGWDEWSAKAG